MEAATQVKQFPCGQCGAKLEFQPGAQALKCSACGAETPIPQTEADVRELDYGAYLAGAAGKQEQHEQITVTCNGCGAVTTLAQDITADKCAFCGSPLVAQCAARKSLKPGALLPFKVTMNQARAAFKAWIASRWFAPSDLKTYAETSTGLQGVYVPYWTFDCHAISYYRGERGDDYTTTEKYTTIENGKSVTKTRTVTKTRWTPVSGVVFNDFDDLLVLASKSLPRKYADELEPWDLDGLTPFRDDFLSGFKTESYQIGLGEGFEAAKEKSQPAITERIEEDIGGDHQRIHTVKTRYENITFKHLLLPIWISAYRFRDKVYRILVNARTAEVQGERPWSWGKIALLALGALAAVAAVVVLALAKAAN